jgi:hypothetical protein
MTQATARKIQTTDIKSAFIPLQTKGGSVGERIYLIRANDHSGHRAYYFLLAHALRVPQLHKALQSGASFDLESYGEIIASGYGDVPRDVRDRIRKEYGWKG